MDLENNDIEFGVISGIITISKLLCLIKWI